MENAVDQSQPLAYTDLKTDTEFPKNIVSENYSSTALSALCGEVLHPDVEKFILSRVGNDCSNEVVCTLRKMCQSFFKMSAKQYLCSIESILVNQSFQMVTSYLSGMEVSKELKSNCDDLKTSDYKSDKCDKCHAFVEPQTLHICVPLDSNQSCIHDISKKPEKGKTQLSSQMVTAAHLPDQRHFDDKADNQCHTVHQDIITTTSSLKVDTVISELSNENSGTLNFPLIPVHQISDDFPSYEDVWNDCTATLTPLQLAQINDIEEFANLFSNDLHNALFEYKLPDSLYENNAVDLSNFTLSVLSLNSEATIFQEERKETMNLLHEMFCTGVNDSVPLSSVGPAYATMPFKKRPVPSHSDDEFDFEIFPSPEHRITNTSTAKSLNQWALETIKKISDARKKKLKLDDVQCKENCQNICESSKGVDATTSVLLNAVCDDKPLADDSNDQAQQTLSAPSTAPATHFVMNSDNKPDSCAFGSKTSSLKEKKEIYESSSSLTGKSSLPCSFDSAKRGQSTTFNDLYDDWDDDIIRQLDESVAFIGENGLFPSIKSSSMANNTAAPALNSIPLKPLFFCHVFSSKPVEKAVHDYIVSNIPAPYPARSPRIIKILRKHWVDHRTFGLSMQVYGSISSHVINIMAVAVNEEQFNKHYSGSLPSSTWCRHIFSNSVSLCLQNPDLVPTEISHFFSEKCIGFSLDNADLVFLPVCKNRFWYVVVVNIKEGRFEVICPFKDIFVVQQDAFVIVKNFRKVFVAAYSRSRRADVYDFGTAFTSVSNSTSQNDSGVFVLQLLKSYDGQTHFHFKEEHSKSIREALTYYLCTHDDNQVFLPEIYSIAEQHGIQLTNQASRTYKRPTE